MAPFATATLSMRFSCRLLATVLVATLRRAAGATTVAIEFSSARSGGADASRSGSRAPEESAVDRAGVRPRGGGAMRTTESELGRRGRGASRLGERCPVQTRPYEGPVG